MSPRPLRLAPFLALALISLAPLPAAAQRAERVAMTVVPRDAAIASVPLRAGEAGDLCAPGEELRRSGSGWVCETRPGRLAALAAATYQTFELGSATPGAPTRFAAACLGREDRVLEGTCVRRAAGGYVSFAGRATTAGGSEGVECALDGVEAASAVGIAICLDLPPLR